MVESVSDGGGLCLSGEFGDVAVEEPADSDAYWTDIAKLNNGGRRAAIAMLDDIVDPMGGWTRRDRSILGMGPDGALGLTG